MTENFNCCRQCSPKGTHATWAEVVTAFEVLNARRREVTKIFQSKASFDNFIEDWMSNHSAYDRKELSYYGGLTMDLTKPNIPQSFSDEREHSAESVFFDPGNWTYMKGMQLISPELSKSHGWNQETVGDIWESFLGYRFLHHDQRGADEQLLKIANWVDSYMNSVHVFVFLAAAISDSFWMVSTNYSMLSTIDQWGVFVRHRADCTVAARMAPAVEKTLCARVREDLVKHRGDLDVFVRPRGDCTVAAKIAPTVEESLCARVREALVKHRGDRTVAAKLAPPPRRRDSLCSSKRSSLYS